MIDIHSHILRNFDDGPKTLENSIALVKDSSAQGIRKFASTSHYYSSHMPLDEFLNRRERRIKELRDELAVRQIGVEIVAGAEVHLTEVLFNLSDISGLCYEGTNYILIEIPHSEKTFESPLHMIERLTSYYNVKPVIAHIERYSYLYKNDANLAKLRSLGCLFQIDAEVLLAGSFFKKRAIMRLIREGKVDFVASDCHGDARQQNLEAAFEVIEKKFGSTTCERFRKTPYMMLDDVNPDDIML